MRRRGITAEVEHGDGCASIARCELKVASQYDMLPEPGRPMGRLCGVAQLGFVVVGGTGTIRIQRTDLRFGEHAGQMLEIIRRLTIGATAPSATR